MNPSRLQAGAPESPGPDCIQQSQRLQYAKAGAGSPSENDVTFPLAWGWVLEGWEVAEGWGREGVGAGTGSLRRFRRVLRGLGFRV